MCDDAIRAVSLQDRKNKAPQEGYHRNQASTVYAHLFLITREVAFDKHRGLKEEKEKGKEGKQKRRKENRRQ